MRNFSDFHKKSLIFLYFFYLTNGRECDIMSGASTIVQAPNLPLYHSLQILSIDILHKKIIIQILKFCAILTIEISKIF
jgi:hypothetical protein